MISIAYKLTIASQAGVFKKLKGNNNIIFSKPMSQEVYHLSILIKQ